LLRWIVGFANFLQQTNGQIRESDPLKIANLPRVDDQLTGAFHRAPSDQLSNDRPGRLVPLWRRPIEHQTCVVQTADDRLPDMLLAAIGKRVLYPFDLPLRRLPTRMLVARHTKMFGKSEQAILYF
jgi:hypothetical protein